MRCIFVLTYWLMVPYTVIDKAALINKLLLVPALLCLLFSCAKKDADTGDYSEPFKAFTTELAKPVHHHTLEQEQQFIDSAYHEIKNPFINDIFRYYGFKFLYYKKGINQPKKALVYADSMLMM